MVKKGVIFLALLGLIIGVSCSEEKQPYRPPFLVEGKVSIFNQSGVRIRLLEFTQQRGERETTVVLNRSIISGVRYFLINQLDPGNTDIFPGGDYIIIHYIADVPNPGDPSQPLFDQTIDHTVNGVTVYYVKSGGRYTVQP
jgi:hypothetical protein